MAWAPTYATEDQLASYLRIDDTADDVELAGVEAAQINTASSPFVRSPTP